MSIKYFLLENKLTENPDDYFARVQSTGAAELEDVVERILQQGSTVTRADIYSVMEDFFTTLERMVLEGRTVRTPVANFGISIKGTFDGPEDSFDANRHEINARVNPGRRLRATIRTRARPVKQESITRRPNIMAFIDLETDARNDTLTPGAMGRISGHRLQFEDVPEQGVFFIAEDGTETRVEAMGRNKPSELIFMVPDTLTAGDYVCEVRAPMYEDGDVRVDTLDDPLTVS